MKAVQECIEILKSISAVDPLDYNGELFQVKNYHPFWATQTMPKVYVAANKPQMLKMSSRLSDGIMMSDLPASLIKNIVEEVSVHLKTFGREPDDFRFNNFMAWALYDDKKEAIKEAKQWLGYRGLFRRWVITTFMSDKEYDLIEAHKQEIYQMPKSAQKGKKKSFMGRVRKHAYCFLYRRKKYNQSRTKHRRICGF